MFSSLVTPRNTRIRMQRTSNVLDIASTRLRLRVDPSMDCSIPASAVSPLFFVKEICSQMAVPLERRTSRDDVTELLVKLDPITDKVESESTTTKSSLFSFVDTSEKVALIVEFVVNRSKDFCERV